MKTTRLPWWIMGLILFVTPILIPVSSHAQANQAGNWGAPANGGQRIYLNDLNTAVKLMVTVCNKQGPLVDLSVEVSNTITNINISDPGVCSSTVLSLPALASLFVENHGAAAASGRYSISSPLP